MSLPFLKRKLPVKGKLVGTSKYGFSEDDDLQEHALHELVDAYHAKDPKLLVEALKTLIGLINGKEDAQALQESITP